jgi:hypothetical protein
MSGCFCAVRRIQLQDLRRFLPDVKNALLGLMVLVFSFQDLVNPGST